MLQQVCLAIAAVIGWVLATNFIGYIVNTIFGTDSDDFVIGVVTEIIMAVIGVAMAFVVLTAQGIGNLL